MFRAYEFENQAESLCDVVDGFEVNISCPNQIGARDLAEKIDILRDTLQGVYRAANGKPIFLKISPDTDIEALKKIIKASREYVTGYRSTNTTTDPEIRTKILAAS
jgi:dihydroorotate dehydrogenase